MQQNFDQKGRITSITTQTPTEQAELALRLPGKEQILMTRTSTVNYESVEVDRSSRAIKPSTEVVDRDGPSSISEYQASEYASSSKPLRVRWAAMESAGSSYNNGHDIRITGLEIIENVSEGVFEILLDEKTALISIEVLQSSLAGRMSLSQFDIRYRWGPWKWMFWKRWNSRDKDVNRLALEINTTDGGFYLTGCIPEIRASDEAIKKNWTGRVLLVQAKWEMSKELSWYERLIDLFGE